MGVGGDQLQPGVEDGGTPTEVVAALKLRNPEIQQNRKPLKKEENQKIKNKQTQKEGPAEYPGEGAATTSAAGPS